MNAWVVLAGVVLIAALYVVFPVGLAMWACYRRQKLVGCPVGYRPATIRVGRAGLAEATGIRALRRIRRCSLWPTRHGCARRCLELPEERIRETTSA
jgi:hypothetical protein